MVHGQESKEAEEGLHSRRTELQSEQHMSCELGNCPAGVQPPVVSIPRPWASMDFRNFFRSEAYM